MKKVIYILLLFVPVVVFSQQSWYKSSPSDQMWIYVGNYGFSAGEVDFTCLAFSPSGQPYVAYEDMSFGGADKATVMKFDGTNWIQVGIKGFSAGQVAFVSLAVSALDGQPYLAYMDFGNSYKATVMKFDGNNWVNVGNAGFSAGQVWCTSLAFSPPGQPYIAYTDFGNSQKATVMKFDGTDWMNVGNAGFSVGAVYNTSLAFNPTDSLPYVAYIDHGNSFMATVMKFDGTNWVNVGNAGFSAGHIKYPSLAFSSSGDPYIAYSDSLNAKKATVMKFDGTTWVNVGNPGFSDGETAFTSLAFNPVDGEPYVAFVDYANSNRITVMKFNGTNWENEGLAGFTESISANPSLAFNSAGTPYVAFSTVKASVMEYNYPTGLKEPQDSRLSLYPDPVTDNLTIDFKIANNEVRQVEIYESRGKKIFETQTDKSRLILNVENYPCGMYLIKVESGCSSWNAKFLKIK
jgi:hypothetical protein